MTLPSWVNGVRWLVSLPLFALAGCVIMGEAPPSPAPRTTSPLVIAHRGASGYLPEHTLEGYARAIALGADFIEPDLVATKDFVLIARHEPMLSETTDVSAHPEFAARKTTREVDGESVTDWFALDFTLAEIKTLRARQAFAERDQNFNGQFEIPTFAEIIALAKNADRPIGIYPETKHPTFHRDLGLPLEDRILDMLAAEGWTGKTAPVILQSFEVSNLKYLRERTGVRLVLLVDAPDKRPYDFVVAGDSRTYLDLMQNGLNDVARFADGIGVAKDYIVPVPGEAPTQLIAAAHEAGLFVHAYTFRSDARFLAAFYQGDPAREYKAFYAAGLDGVFSDFADAAVAAR
ncbi:MAG: hypothetical protein RJB62_1716 [Pseudomonadota bacterium]|jgi:glycerophosphoryl diester phosphodiesterase